MTRLFLAIALAALAPAAVARQQAPEPQADAGAGPGCLDLARVVRQEPAGPDAKHPDAIRFVLTGGRTVVNRLANACPRLEELGGFRQIVWDARDGRRVCAGDRFRLVEPTQARAVGVSGFPFCRLGRFERAQP